jgi:UDP-N-acetylmuramyl pentapeptide phosphotransferase/UDP-N-acetylglucosamine-1-phosphate transferase
MMNNLLDLGTAFLGTALSLPLWVRLGRRLGWVDVPEARSTHASPVPRVGGLALVTGLAAGLLAGVGRMHPFLDALAPWWPYLIPGVLFFAIGLWDDLGRPSARVKFTAQALAAAAAVALGLRWEGAALEPFGALAFGVATPVLTWLWIVAVVTLVNLLDGLDLITAATCAVVLGACAGAGAGPGEGLLYGLALAALLGFVPWNVAPARAFLGDAGTHLLGFLVATAALHVPDTTHALPWVLASAPLLPGVIDLAWGLRMKRRLRVPFAKAHNQHLSQRLTHAGWSHAAVAVRYGALGVLALVLAAVVAPRAGLVMCLAVAAGVLLLHLTHAWRIARDVPYRF